MKTDQKWNVHEALVYIQTNLNAPKKLFNKFGGYKYRNLEGITDALKPYLKETNCVFVITDNIVEMNGRYYVESHATLMDSQGETRTAKGWAREAENKKGMDEAQITGSSSSYARKYAANGLFAIDDTKDPDDTNKHGRDEAKPKKTEATNPKLTNERFDKMKAALKQDAEKYAPDVKRTLKTVSATKEQVKTLEEMMS